jgi:integrase
MPASLAHSPRSTRPGAQRSLSDFQTADEPAATPETWRPPEVPRPGRPRANGREWDSEVDTFVQEWERRRSIGVRWVRGLRYTLGRVPSLLEGSGTVPRPYRANDLTGEHVAVLRARPGWSRATTQFYFAGLRQFLRWHGNPISDQADLWRLSPGESPHRRWLTREDLAQLYRGATGSSRLIIALEGFNGLRRIEVLRLRAMDVNLAEGWINVRGKGRMGGKWRQIPLGAPAREELRAVVRKLGPQERVLPYSASWADQQLAAAARSSGLVARGLRISHHDLRRTFGRLAHAAGMDLVQLKNLYGHSSLEMSVHYIGLDLDRMREGLGQVDRSLTPLVRRERPEARTRVRTAGRSVTPSSARRRTRRRAAA